MRIRDWTLALKPQTHDPVDAILKRRGATLINLDKALLLSEPLARGWNVYLKAVCIDLPTSPKLRELGICTVALLAGAAYEYTHQAPDFLTARGTQAELDALISVVNADARNWSRGFVGVEDFTGGVKKGRETRLARNLAPNGVKG